MDIEEIHDVEDAAGYCELLATVVRGRHAAAGLQWYTTPDMPQQVATMRHPAGHIIPPHSHPEVRRTIRQCSEAVFVVSGRLRVQVYSRARHLMATRELAAGDFVVLTGGGHGFDVLEDLVAFYCKQGPHVGDKDKVRFVPEE